MHNKYTPLRDYLLEKTGWMGTDLEHYANLLFTTIIEGMEDYNSKNWAHVNAATEFFNSELYRGYCQLLNVSHEVVSRFKDHLEDTLRLVGLLKKQKVENYERN